MLQEGYVLHHRYQLIQLLGERAGQQTWQATDLGSQGQPDVVMKFLAMNPQMRWEEAKLLEREAQILQRLNHPRIPRYCDYFVLEQLAHSRFPWFCLVQSHVPGSSLQQLLEQGRRFTEAEIEKIAIEVLSILVYLHEFDPPILHRDIKPSNLIWGKDDRLYLIDFGSVQDQGALEGATFTIVGTYGYVPMEQFGGRAVPASDLYALGASLIHLLTGATPADLPHQNARIQFAHQVSIHPTLVNWVSKMTEPDLGDRLKTAREALYALENRHQLSLPVAQPKPKRSRIQLKKTVDYLEVRIPPRGWQAISWLSCLGMFSSSWWLLLQVHNIIRYPWFSLIVLLLLLLLLLLPLLALTFLPAIKQTVIQGDRTHLTFYWKLWGIPIWKKRVRTAHIHPAISVYEQEKQGIKGISIQADATTLSTNPMAEVERRWLVQEIKDWLNRGQPQIAIDGSAGITPFHSARLCIQTLDDELRIQFVGTEIYWKIAIVPSILLWWFFTQFTFPVIGIFAPAASLFITMLTVAVGGRLYGNRFPTIIRFSRDRFIFYKKLLGYTVKLGSGHNADINEITQAIPENLKAKGWLIYQLVIRMRDKDYSFGWNMTKTEQQWILQSIQHWLQQSCVSK